VDNPVGYLVISSSSPDISRVAKKKRKIIAKIKYIKIKLLCFLCGVWLFLSE
jgi:hypothetical protein